MRRATLVIGICTFAASAAVFVVGGAASQSPIRMTPQIQIIGAAANNQSHGAWFIDLESRSVVFCERLATRTQCQATALP